MVIVQNHCFPDYDLYCPGAELRRTYYDFIDAPAVLIDGTSTGIEEANIQAMVSARLSAPSPLDVTFISATTSQVTLSIHNVSSDPVTGVLHVVVTENGIVAGGVDWDWVSRSYLPDGNGVALTLAPGASTTVSRVYALGEGWEVGNLRVVAFVQQSDRSILQGQETVVSLPPVPDFDINADGSVNDADVVLLGRMLAGDASLNGKQDVDQDGVFDASDLALTRSGVSK